MAGDVVVHRLSLFGSPRLRAELGGPLLTAAVLIAVWLLSNTPFALPSPVGVGLVVTAVSSLIGGWRPGLISAAMVVGYGVLVHVAPGASAELSWGGVGRVLVLAVAAPAVALAVGVWRRRLTRKVADLEAAYERLAGRHAEGEAKRAELERRVAELSGHRDVLARRLRRARVFVDAMDRLWDGVLVADRCGRIRYANEAAASIYGIARQELVGRGLESLYAPGGPDSPRRRCAEGGEDGWAGETVHQRADGTPVPVHVTEVVTRRPGGEPMAYVLIVRDRTESRRVQAQLMESEKLATVGGLVSGVAHELNNPLSAISNFAQLMLLDESDGSRQEMIELIARESRRAGEIVRNLLSFSRGSDQDRRFVRLDEVVRRTLTLRAYEQRRNRIDVSVSLEPGLPEIWADPNQIQQVLLNLVINAEHAIGRRGRITIRARPIDGAWVELEVADNGPGIPESVRPHVFTPFYTTKGADRGTGLGLPISREIIERHGGSVDVRNEPNGGACFRVRLPIDPEAATPLRMPGPASAEEPS